MSEQELRAVPIRQVGVRVTMLMGGDRELVMASAVLSAMLIVPFVTDWRGWVSGIAVWFFAVFALRLAGKADPMMRHVYVRHIRYKHYYPARSTPWRKNVNSQTYRYSTPMARK